MLILQAIRQDLHRAGENLVRLGRASDELTPHMDSATAVLVTSRENALQQKMASLQQTLASHVTLWQKEVTRQAKFGEAFALVSDFLSNADSVISHAADGNTTSADTRQLRHVTSELNRRPSSLDLLNDIGFRLPLTDANSRRLRDLNRKWRDFQVAGARALQCLQSASLRQETLDVRMEQCSRYLDEVEDCLVEEDASSRDDVMQQQQRFAVSRKQRSLCYENSVILQFR